MKDFQKLIEITETLNGPNGCPWDKKQTLRTLRPHLMEELHEVIEAIDEDNSEMLVEELGDLLFIIVFCANLGEKGGRFNMGDILEGVTEKLIRRHPHVFGEVRLETAEEVLHQWEEIKKKEKNEEKPQGLRIPKTLGTLARAQKMLSRIEKYKLALPKLPKAETDEEKIGAKLLELVQEAKEKNLDADTALREVLSRIEKGLEF